MSPNLLNVLLIVLPAVLWFGYIQPKYTGDEGLVWTPEKSIKALQGEYVQYVDALSQIDNVQREADKILKDYKTISEEDKQKINDLLPSEIDPVKLRSEVIDIAARSGIALTDLKVDVDPKEKGVYVISFSFNAHYPKFKELVEQYEKSTRLFIAEKVSIQRSVVEEGARNAIQDTELLNIILSFKVYTKK
jgi:hypothetical protein